MRAGSLERRIGLTLAVVTTASMGLVSLAVAMMALKGVDPLARPYPAFDPASLGSDVLSGRAEGLLWLGLIAVILTPAVRVGASLAGFAAAGDRRQAAIALAVLAIMLLGVTLGRGG